MTSWSSLNVRVRPCRAASRCSEMDYIRHKYWELRHSRGNGTYSATDSSLVAVVAHFSFSTRYILIRMTRFNVECKKKKSIKWNYFGQEELFNATLR